MSEPTHLQRTFVERLKSSAAQVASNRQQATALSTIFNLPMLSSIDTWIASQNDPALDRVEAVRRLVEKGLRAK